MKDIHLHNLLQQIGENLVCPHCQSSIPLLSLRLVESSENACQFTAHCDVCDNSMNISAVVESKPSAQAEKMNASTRIRHSIGESTPFSEKDVQTIRSTLQDAKSFHEIFK